MLLQTLGNSFSRREAGGRRRSRGILAGPGEGMSHQTSRNTLLPKHCLAKQNEFTRAKFCPWATRLPPPQRSRRPLPRLSGRENAHPRERDDWERQSAHTRRLTQCLEPANTPDMSPGDYMTWGRGGRQEAQGNGGVEGGPTGRPQRTVRDPSRGRTGPLGGRHLPCDGQGPRAMPTRAPMHPGHTTLSGLRKVPSTP